MGERHRLVRTLDYAVCVMVIVSGVLGVIAMVTQTHTPPSGAGSRITAIELVGMSLAVLFSVVLILWLVKGDGVRSRLWDWLPPFWCFRYLGHIRRLLLVIAMILWGLVALVTMLLRVG